MTKAKTLSLAILASVLAPMVLHADERSSVTKEMKDVGAAMQGSESHTTTTLKENPDRIWVADVGYPVSSGGAAPEASKAYAIDGKTGKFEGMFSMGYWPNMGQSPDSREVYSLDTFYTKHTRGERHDYVTVRDGKTLDIVGEVELPKGRLIMVPKKNNFDVTPGGEFGLSYNLAPATTVSVVDLIAKEYRGEIPTPGCGLIFASAKDRFTSICSDGTLLTTTFSVEGGKLKTSQKRTAKVFDVEKDPLFEHAGIDRQGKMVHFVSYGGKVYSTDLSGDVAKPEQPWQFNADEPGWLPGGWQLAAFNQKTGLLYVLMHEGGPWTHKNSGEEIWVLDPKARKLVKRIKLADPALSVAVSQSAKPRIYTASESTDLIFYDENGEETVKVDKLGDLPLMLYVAGEY